MIILSECPSCENSHQKKKNLFIMLPNPKQALKKQPEVKVIFKLVQKTGLKISRTLDYFQIPRFQLHFLYRIKRSAQSFVIFKAQS